jgi:hypothetical protein
MTSRKKQQLQPKHYELIESTLSAVDWEKAARMYSAVDWTWGAVNDKHIPGAKELRREAFRMATGAIQRNSFCSSTGGITVYWVKLTGLLAVHVGEGAEEWLDEAEESDAEA